MKWALNFLGGFLVASATWAFGKIDDLIYALLFFLIADWITGMTAAWMNGELSSKEGRRGITKKVGTLFLVIVVYQADKIVPDIAGWEAPLRDVTISALIVNDFISVIENLGKWGVPIPEVIKKRLEQLHHLHEKGGHL